MMTSPRLFCWVALGGAWLSMSSPAWSQGATDVAMAESLYQEGARLLGQGKLTEACAKLAESQRLDSGGGTLFLLAECHEKQGKTASAWAEYGEVAALARQKQRADIEARASARVAALELKVFRLTVEPATNRPVAGLEVKLNGRTLDPTALGSALPVDPGEQVIEASAPGYVTVKISVMVGSSGVRNLVTLPPLQKLAVVSAPPLASSAPAVFPSSSASGRGIPTTAYLAGGVGVAGFIVGGIFGARALSKARSSNDICPSRQCSDPAAVQDSKNAVAASWVSNLGWGVGFLGAIATVYFVVANRHEAKDSARWQVVPVIENGLGGVRAGGRF